MSKYIKSEFYRLLRNKWTYLFIVLCSAILLSADILLAVVKCTDSSFAFATTAFAFSNFYTSILLVYILCVTVASMVFGNEYSNHTLKNSVSYGISRGTIYFGKLIVEIVYAVIAFTIITGFYVAAGYLLLENSGIGHLKMLLSACFVCLPHFLFALALTNCFSFIAENTGGSIAAISGVLFVLPLACKLLGMKYAIIHKLSLILPWNMIQDIGFDTEKLKLTFSWPADAAYGYYWISGISQMILIAIIGYMVFRRKEIK